MSELNALVRKNTEPEKKPLLLVLRAEALALLGEKADALEDARSALAIVRDEKLEDEASRLVQTLRGVAAELRAPRGSLLPGSTSVAILGSARGALAVEWALYRIDDQKLRALLARSPDRATGGSTAVLDALLRRPPPEILARADGGRFSIEAKGRFEHALEVPATRTPGLYLLVASVADVPVRATLEVARHGLAARLTASGALVWAFDRLTGEPREGAALDRLADHGADALGVTDRSGLATMERVEGQLLAWSEGALARLSLAPSSSDGIARSTRAVAPLDLLVERPLVRPGESVRALAVSPVGSAT
ncbi:MAG: hypothetical protein ACAI25_18365, partial [Planctomycetota bacterium]